MEQASQFEWQTVLDGYRAVSNGDWERVSVLYHPEIEWLGPPGIPGRSSYRGPDGVKQAWERFTDVWGEWRVDAVEARDLGEQLLVRVRFSSRNLGIGTEGSTEFFQLWTARDGLIIRQETFVDEEQALKVAGVEL